MSVLCAWLWLSGKLIFYDKMKHCLTECCKNVAEMDEYAVTGCNITSNVCH